MGRGVLEVRLLLGFDRLAHIGAEAGMLQETSLETSSCEMAWLSTSLASRRSRNRLLTIDRPTCSTGFEEPSAVLPPSVVSRWACGCQTMGNDAAGEEPAQDPLDHRAWRAMLPDEATGPDPQQLLKVLLHETEKR